MIGRPLMSNENNNKNEEFKFEILDVEGVNATPTQKIKVEEQKKDDAEEEEEEFELSDELLNIDAVEGTSINAAKVQNPPVITESNSFELSPELGSELDLELKESGIQGEDGIPTIPVLKEPKVTTVATDDDFEINPDLLDIDNSPTFSSSQGERLTEDEDNATFDDALIQDEDKFKTLSDSGTDGFQKAMENTSSGIDEKEVEKEVDFDEFLTESSKTGQFASIKLPEIAVDTDASLEADSLHDALTVLSQPDAKFANSGLANNRLDKGSLTQELDAIGELEDQNNSFSELLEIDLLDDTTTSVQNAITDIDILDDTLDEVDILTTNAVAENITQPAHESQKPRENSTSVIAEISHKGLEHLGKSFYNAKDRAEEFFGKSLPIRELALDFRLPAPKPKKEIGTIIRKGDVRDIFNQKGGSQAAMFEKAEQQLNILSKTKLSVSARKDILDAFFTHMVIKIKIVIASYERKPTIPDEPQRQLQVDFCQAAIKHLITGYKQVYADLYGRTNLAYGPRRNQANTTAYHLFELVYLEQQLIGGLYKRLPASSINTVNKLFNVLWLYEAALVDEPKDSVAVGRKITIKEMFLHIQMGVSFDLMFFSAMQHTMVTNYLDYHINRLNIMTPAEIEASPDSLKWIIPHEHRDAALLIKQASTEILPAITLPVHKLLDTIKADYAECLLLLDKKTPVHSSPILAAKKIGECLSLLSVLDTFARQMENNISLPIYTSYKTLDLQIFAGFKECFMYFRDKNAGREDHRTLKDSLAKRSSVMSEDKGSETSTMWYCAMEDDKVIHLQTLETKFTVKMDIGWLMLIIRKIDGKEETTLTRIVRIERLPGGKVNLIVEKLGLKSADVTFEPWLATDSAKGQLLPAILTVKADGKYFVAPNNDRFWKGRQFKVNMPNKKVAPIALDSLQSATHRFQVFKLV